MNSSKSSPPFVLQSGKSRNVIFETPHLGRATPDELQRHSKLVEAAARRWDNHIDRAGEMMLAEVGGEWIGSVYSRMVVDLNRGPDRVDSRVSPDWPGARIYEDGGVIVPFVKNKTVLNALYENPLNPEEIEHRLKQYWFPFHDQLQARIDAILHRFGHAILISLHSAEPEPEHCQGDMPVVYLGTGNGSTCDAGMLSIIRTVLENSNIQVISELYYQGAFTTQAYGKDPHVHAVQIELDRRFMKTDAEIKRQLEPLAAALQTVSTGGVGIAPSSSRAKRLSGRRTYIDPLTGDVLPY